MMPVRFFPCPQMVRLAGGVPVILETTVEVRNPRGGSCPRLLFALYDCLHRVLTENVVPFLLPMRTTFTQGLFVCVTWFTAQRKQRIGP